MILFRFFLKIGHKGHWKLSMMMYLVLGLLFVGVPNVHGGGFPGEGSILYMDVSGVFADEPADPPDRPSLYSVSPDGTISRILTGSKLGQNAVAPPTEMAVGFYATDGCLGGKVSPDGQYLTFVDLGHHIITATYRKPNLVLVTGFGNLDLAGDFPALSPDGSKLIYRDGKKNLILTDGNSKQELQKKTGEARWSPDGSLIAFERDGTLYVMAADGSGARAISGKFSAISGISWSPDGTRLAVGARQTGKNHIWLVGVNNQAAQEIMPDEKDAKDDQPCWSPDGARLVFVRNDNQLYTMNVDGTDVNFITKGSSPSWIQGTMANTQ